jgi:hypothetical protein
MRTLFDRLDMLEKREDERTQYEGLQGQIEEQMRKEEDERAINESIIEEEHKLTSTYEKHDTKEVRFELDSDSEEEIERQPEPSPAKSVPSTIPNND